MGGNDGVIAEGWINGKWYSSLGKEGVDKNGRLKKNACSTLESAIQRALKCCANKVRTTKNGVDGWVEFRNLPKATQTLLIEDVLKNVNLEMVEPNLYRTTFNENIFQNSMERVWA